MAWNQPTAHSCFVLRLQSRGQREELRLKGRLPVPARARSGGTAIVAGHFPSAHPAKPNRMTVSANEAEGMGPPPGSPSVRCAAVAAPGIHRPLTVDSEQSQRGHHPLSSPNIFTDQDLRLREKLWTSAHQSRTEAGPALSLTSEHVSRTTQSASCWAPGNKAMSRGRWERG